MTNEHLFEPNSWVIGPLPILLTIWSGVVIGRILQGGRKANSGAIPAIFCLATAVVTAGAYVLGIRERTSLSANVFAMASMSFALVVVVLLHVLRLRKSFFGADARSNLSPFLSASLLLVVCLGPYFLFTAFPTMLIDSKCTGWCKGGGVLLGDVLSALPHIWYGSFLWGSLVLFFVFSVVRILRIYNSKKQS